MPISVVVDSLTWQAMALVVGATANANLQRDLVLDSRC